MWSHVFWEHSVVIRWAVDVIEVIYYIHGPMETEVLSLLRPIVHDTSKTAKIIRRFFVLMFAVFLPDFIFCTTVTDSLKFHQNFACVRSLVTPHKSITFTVRLAATTTTKETVLR